MSRYVIPIAVIFLGVFYGVYLYLFRIQFVQTDIHTRTSGDYYDYRGITNVHTNLSTGSSSPNDVITVAQEARADFLILTDLNLATPPQHLEGYHGQVLVLSGGQYSYLDSRLLYYNIPYGQPPDRKGQAQVYFADLLSQANRPLESGFLVLSHPFLSGFEWSGPVPPGLDGIEVLNLKRVLERAWNKSRLSIFSGLFMYPLNPELALLFVLQDPSEELQLWDKLNLTRPTIGMIGTDATAKAILWGDTYLRFPSYETMFNIASNHVLLKSELTGNTAKDKAKILNALRNGEFYFSIDLLSDPRGFFCELRQGKSSFPMGAKVRLKEKTVLHVELPRVPQVPFETVIYRDSVNVFISNNVVTDYEIKAPGSYRVVVRLIPSFPFPFGKRWISWIYTNPFFVSAAGN